MNGLLVLDERGFDRVAIGQDYPDPNIGQRLGRATGVVINDTMGFERSGYGLLRIDDQDRMVLGLDGPHGREGVVLSILEDGTAGLQVMHRQQGLFAGRAPKGSFIVQDTVDLFGVALTDSMRVRQALR